MLCLAKRPFKTSCVFVLEIFWDGKKLVPGFPAPHLRDKQVGCEEWSDISGGGSFWCRNLFCRILQPGKFMAFEPKRGWRVSGWFRWFSFSSKHPKGLGDFPSQKISGGSNHHFESLGKHHQSPKLKGLQYTLQEIILYLLYTGFPCLSGSGWPFPIQGSTLQFVMGTLKYMDDGCFNKDTAI